MTFDPMMQPAMPLDNGLDGLNGQIPPPQMANSVQLNGNDFSTALPAVDPGASTNAGTFADSTQGNDSGQVI